MTKIIRHKLCLLILIPLLLAGCGLEATSPSGITLQAALPTPTLAPTFTPSATATQTGTPTATSISTSTPIPTVTPTATDMPLVPSTVIVNPDLILHGELDIAENLIVEPSTSVVWVEPGLEEGTILILSEVPPKLLSLLGLSEAPNLVIDQAFVITSRGMKGAKPLRYGTIFYGAVTGPVQIAGKDRRNLKGAVLIGKTSSGRIVDFDYLRQQYEKGRDPWLDVSYDLDPPSLADDVPPSSITSVYNPTPTPTATPVPPTPTSTSTPTPIVVQPTLAPPANCPGSQSVITSPLNGATISGVTPFIGTADVPNLQYYKFEYRPKGTSDWQFVTLVEGTTVVNDKLMDWHTRTVPPGTYDLRLIVIDMSGNYPAPCEIQVTVIR